jgi:ribosomal protein S18 acetylase RimI-like enzyme
LEFSIDNKTHEFKNVANYNQAMVLTASSRADVAATADAATTAHSLRFVPVGEEAWGFCRALAKANMEPYLIKRGQRWSDATWDKFAATRELFQLFADRSQWAEAIGFVSLWFDDDQPAHLGDLQLITAAQGQGYGTLALARVCAIARSRGRSELTLNVFRDNPAIHLYERMGFKVIDHGFDKLKMRCALGALRAQDDASLGRRSERC